jgi:hypothetical protein
MYKKVDICTYAANMHTKEQAIQFWAILSEHEAGAAGAIMLQSKRAIYDITCTYSHAHT